MTNCLTLVSFDHLNPPQMGRLRRLGIPDDQQKFGGSFEETLEQYLSYACPTIRGFCILKTDGPVGLMVLKRPPSSPDWVPEDAASLHGLKIDQRWQGRGLGKRALLLAIDEAVAIWPGLRQLVLTVDAGNSTALALYRSFAMEDSGPVHEGRLGREHRMTKYLDQTKN